MSAKISEIEELSTLQQKEFATEEPDSSGSANTNQKPAFKKNVLFLLTAGAIITGGYFFCQHLLNYQDTDDAYVTAHVTPVSSRVEANVEDVYIDDNQHVKKGQLLVKLDPRDFLRKVEEAQAQLERVKLETNVSQRSVTLAEKNAQATKLNASGDMLSTASSVIKAEVAIKEASFALDEQHQVLLQRDAEVVRADLDYKRYFTLEQDRAVTTSSRDAAKRDLDVATAARDATKRNIDQKQALLQEARQQLEIAKAQNIQSRGVQHTAEASVIQKNVNELQVDVSTAAIKEAQARLNTALLNLSYTNIYAPVSGRIGRKTIEVGQRVQTGGRLFTLTEDETWVVANFKENQIENMHVGQTVEIKVDALPHEKFEGVVDSFSPGSGAQFTLLPPDNATGNFTKIVQRIPVKIRFKGSIRQYLEKLVPGLSAVVSVSVHK